MGFKHSPAAMPLPRDLGDDARLTDLFVDDAVAADVHMAGIPYDRSVVGRRGTKEGPTAIREAFRYVANNDPRRGRPSRPAPPAPAADSLAGLRIFDHGDVGGLGVAPLKAHEKVRSSLAEVFSPGRPAVLLGGDHGLSYPNVMALADQVEGDVGIVVIDAHYDLRDYQGQPTSGTPFYRLITESERVKGPNVAELGIRPYANAVTLHRRAQELGVHVQTADEVRTDLDGAIEAALEAAGDGTDHLWLSIDIDGLDQSIAPGCSAPGPGGLLFEEAAAIAEAVAATSRWRGMDILEVAPRFDPSGNTARCAAMLVAHALGAGLGGHA